MALCLAGAADRNGHASAAEPLIDPGRCPYQCQVDEQLTKLSATAPQVRAGAAEALGFLRATHAEPALVALLRDSQCEVRRQAALALAWCGGRAAIPPLLRALDDRDWLTRQGAHVALVNLTGMEFPFDSAASSELREQQSDVWQQWWRRVPRDGMPLEILALLDGPRPWLTGVQLTATSTYRGPPEVLVDGAIGPSYWQTKNVPFPQSLTIDLRQVEPIHEVVIHQYGVEFVMTRYDVAVSVDGARFETIHQGTGPSPVRIAIATTGHPARYVRITSHDAINPVYPTTFFEVEINGRSLRPPPLDADQVGRYERGLRALGTMQVEQSARQIMDFLGDAPPSAERFRPMVTAGIRALGRLRQPESYQYLRHLLDNPMWARRAAEALGEFGDPGAIQPLLAAYPRYAKQLDGSDPLDVPADDKMSFPSEDRMLETAYWIAFALSRLIANQPDPPAELGQIAPLLLANHPSDYDTFFLYEPEPSHLLTRYLLQRSGMLSAAREHTFALLEAPSSSSVTGDAADQTPWPRFEPYRVASWLPIVCTDVDDLGRLSALLEHPEGWVVLNAAKTIAWLGDPRGIEPVARRLAAIPAEAEYGYSGTFKDEEYADPAPRRREGLVRALGLLGAHDHTAAIADILNDERSVLDVRRAAADALADLATPQAWEVLRQAADEHTFYSIRHVARDALRLAGAIEAAAIPSRETHTPSPPAAPAAETPTPSESVWPSALVFLKGDNNLPNTIGTVEQTDRWRQTYVVTDPGPAYRPAHNLYLLSPVRVDGDVRPLTRFADGYVAEPELSWDASHVLFCRRAQADPWWHVWRVNVDGSDLRQLTHGPYHHVSPAYLPDGRIVCASSRVGIRDEYHGYPCTALVVMNADGTDMRPIATNIGRDNEPAVLLDGRLVFSRLEVFYSRNKTELTLHAAHPDGTQDVVLYGPERRIFWRDLDHGPRTPADDQEAPLTHRVLRMTQPQPMPDGRGVIVSTQGGLTLIGPYRDRETIISPDNKTRAYTTPFPLPDGRVLCGSTLKTPDREQVDLGIYLLDPATGTLELIYNDPATADYEPRPVLARRPPRVIPEQVHPEAWSGKFLCSSVFETQEEEVRSRGRLVRLIEGIPMVARHSTQTNPWEVWQNHGGTLARVLGTVPLAADGSFYIEAPADRLLHFQVLDSDRRVVGNQLTWIYTRPGEQKSCVGCHESPHMAARDAMPQAAQFDPILLAPHEGEFRYRAKAWFKGHLPADIEERTRTVRAVNLLGR